MKLQKLTIHNIASIEDAVIDFESFPLSGSEVFLITGKTGAGKSTILDAICLALFADTPRMENTLMQGDTQDAEKTVKINDPRQLMRRNTGEAFARLTFIGSNGIHYEAEWSVSRARKNPEGNLQKKEWTLTNLVESHILTKDKEIKDEIQRAVGLDFSQFCRTTMLAQGEFTRFLNSKDEEKAAILEKITGVDIYSKIGKKVFDITSEKKTAWEKAVVKAEGIHLLSEEELKGLHDTLKELSGQMEQSKAAKKTAETKRDWLSEKSVLERKLNEVKEEFQQYHTVIESEDFKEKERLVRQWNDTIDIREWMKHIASAELQQNKQQELLAACSADFLHALEGKNGIERKYDQRKQKLQEIKESLKADEEKISVYDQAQTIIGKLTTMIEGNRKIAEFQKESEREKGRLNAELKRTKEAMEKKCIAAKSELDLQENRLRQQEDLLTGTQLPALRKQKEEKITLLTSLNTAQERIKNLHLEQDRIEKARKTLDNLMKDIQDSRKKLNELEPQIQHSERDRDEAKENFEKQKDTVNKWAQGIRSKLHPGDVCPVCGQRIESEFIHEDKLADLYALSEQEYQKAEENLRRLKGLRDTLNASVRSQTSILANEKNKLETDRTLQSYKEKAEEGCSLCGIEKMDKDTPTVLIQLREKADHDRETLEQKILAAEKIEKEIVEIRKTIDSFRKVWENDKENLNQADAAITTCRNQIQNYRQLILSKTTEIEEARQQVATLMKGDWQQDWETSPSEFCQELKEAEAAYKDKVVRSETLSQNLNDLSKEIKYIADSKEVIIEMIPSWKDLSVTQVTDNGNLLHDFNELQTKVRSALDSKQEAEETIRNFQLKLDAWFQRNESMNAGRLRELEKITSSEIQTIQEGQSRQKNEALAKETLLKNQDKIYQDHLVLKPELTEEDTVDSLNALIREQDNLITGLGEKKGAVNQQLVQDEDNRTSVGQLVKEADAKKAVFQKWSRMNSLIGDATGSKFRKIAQSYVLSSLIHSANSYMKTLTERYTLKVTPGTFVITLEDAYQGYVSRAASTLSGGESFLVSLSLALALSDIGQDLSVDTLFIDEGFGTLSGEPLQKAIDTLRSLHNKGGKHVGIISHVEELRERIPVQIQVNQEGNHSSSTIKIIPEK